MSDAYDQRPVPSDVEFTFVMAQKHLEELPGDLRSPTNVSWQQQQLASIEHKAAFLQEHDPSLALSLAGLARHHSKRLRAIGSITTANTLSDIAETIEPADEATS